MVVYGVVLAMILAFVLWAYFMMIALAPKGERPEINEAAEQVINDLEKRLRRHVIVLAKEIGERNLFIPENLRKAAEYIRQYWHTTGYEVTTQSYFVQGTECVNLSVEITGKEKPDEIFILGAHYDSVTGSPGANDNGSAVAALLEISRLFHHRPQKRTVRFVAFTNEEPPFFQHQWMGSRVYAQRCWDEGENIVGMLSIETIGYYCEQPHSQHYPPPLGLFYPDRGNFVAVVGNLRARALVRAFARYFMEGIDVPIECVATFRCIPGISWSDHSSFWEYQYPAVMITDTALYRYPYYHTEEDTPDKLNYPALSRVTYGIFCATKKLTE